MTDITQWLSELDLDEYAENFAQHDIDASLLRELDHELLQQIGVASVGHRLRILKAVEQMEASASAAAPASPSADAKTHHPSPAQAERRQLTIMFVDLVGSTVLSRELDPEDLREVNRAFQDAVKNGVEQYDGYVARYMGDGVLAYFGYPQAHEDDAERAVHAGLALTETIAALAPGGLSVRVGIATGPVVVGDLIGDGASQESAVVGETPNLAARLQALAKPGTVLISEGTHALIGRAFRTESITPQMLKGFDKPVPVVRVIEPRTDATRFEARRADALSPLIGRDTELAMVCDRWQQAKAGDGQLVLVSGEAGIGKSRLVHAFQASLADDEPISMTFQCSPHHTRSPFYPVISGVDRAAGIAPSDDGHVRRDKLAAWLAHVSPEDDHFAALAQVLVLSGGQSSDVSARELHLQFLTSLINSPARPVVLLFEDMHWADPTTLEAASALMENLARDRVLVLMTARPEFEPPWVAPEHCTVLSLGRLGRNQRTALVAALGHGHVLSEALMQRIIDQTDGVPLFVEEVTQAVLAGAAAELSGEDSTVPATLHDSLLERLDRLGDAKRVAQHAAVIGRDFSDALLAQAVASLDIDLDRALERLLESGLVFRRRGAGAADFFTFKHALVRDAAYESLLRTHRREAHATIAAALEAHGADESNIEQLAWHHERAGNPWTAARYWHQGAALAQGRTALLEAAALADSGIKALEPLPPSRERDELEIELQHLRGLATRFALGNDAPVFGESYERVRVLTERTGHPRRARALFQLTMYRWGKGDNASMQNLAEDISPFLASDNLADRLFAHTATVAAHIWSDMPIKAHAHTKRLMEMIKEDSGSSEALPSPELHTARSVATIHISRSGVMLGNFDTARAAISRTLANAEKAGVGLVVPALAEVSFYCFAVGDFEQVLEHAERMSELAARARQKWYVALGKGYRLIANALRGGTPAIADLVRFNADPDTDRALARAFVTGSLGALSRHGEWAAIDNIVTRHLPEVERTGWAPTLRPLQTARAVSQAFQARPGSDVETQAIRELYRLTELGLSSGARPRALQAATYLARVLARNGKNQEAHTVLARAYGAFSEGFTTPLLKSSKTLLDELA